MPKLFRAATIGQILIKARWFLLPAEVVTGAAPPQPNPPHWPPSVRMFSPDDDPYYITTEVDAAFKWNGGHEPANHGQFSKFRYAFLFRPGTYHVDIPVGYYTQILGVGQTPHDVVFDAPKGVYCEEGDQTSLDGALSTFWRGAENFRTRGDMLWAVSQAAPLRRAIIDKNLNLAQFVPNVGMGYSSGGFLGNVQVGYNVNSASQQQWCTRNGAFANWPQGNWNMAFIGSMGAPGNHCGRDGGDFPRVSVEETPVIAEKPFISCDDGGRFFLHIPRVQRRRVGVDFDVGEVVDFEKVYVATDKDSAAEINKQLEKGLHIVMSPGVYHIEAPLELRRDNQVILGLGIATLIATQGNAVIRVGHVNGVRLAGLLLEAGTGKTDALLEWGDGSHGGDPGNPGFMHDIYARVGGPNDQAQQQVRASTMVRIAAGHVVGDNLWLWRADHGVGGLVRSSANPCDHGLVVTGDHVTMYGLAVEHTLKDLVQWSGNHGETYFFQSELPYDVSQEFGDAGYVGYRVNKTVIAHKAYAVGVYHFFRDFPVTVQHGIAVPPWLENSFIFPLGVSLSGKGTMLHILNDKGGATTGRAGVAWSCHASPDVEPPHAPAAPAKRPPSPAPPPAATTTIRRASSQKRLAPPPPKQETPPPGFVPGSPLLPASLKTSHRVTSTTTTKTTTTTTTTTSVTSTRDRSAQSGFLSGRLPPLPFGPLATAKAESSQCVGAWGECGGYGWRGPRCCVEGYSCVEHGIWLSQCRPSSEVSNKSHPTVGYTQAFYAADGNPLLNNHPDREGEKTICAKPTSKAAGVRCCSDIGEPCISFCGPEQPRSREEALSKYTDYWEAANQCKSQGRRLCNMEELKVGVCAGAGCFLDFGRVWTSEPCSLQVGLASIVKIDPNISQRTTHNPGFFAGLEEPQLEGSLQDTQIGQFSQDIPWWAYLLVAMQVLCMCVVLPSAWQQCKQRLRDSHHFGSPAIRRSKSLPVAQSSPSPGDASLTSIFSTPATLERTPAVGVGQRLWRQWKLEDA